MTCLLSKPQLNLNRTSTVVGFDMKMTVQITPPPPLHHQHGSLQESQMNIY